MALVALAVIAVLAATTSSAFRLVPRTAPSSSSSSFHFRLPMSSSDAYVNSLSSPRKNPWSPSSARSLPVETASSSQPSTPSPSPFQPTSPSPSPLPSPSPSLPETSTSPSPTDPHVWGLLSWQRGFATVQQESAEALLDGSVPKDLEGTFFRTGFGRFEIGKTARSDGIKVLHPFDADGLISAVTMKDGKATYRHSLVRTDGLRKELKTKKMSGRGTFANHKPRGVLGNFLSLGIKNVANTNVLYWGDRLLALWEGGHPYSMEPDSLRTTGEYDFKGLLKAGDAFTAHPRVDANTGRLVGFTSRRNFGAGNVKSTITVQELDRGNNAVAQVRL